LQKAALLRALGLQERAQKSIDKLKSMTQDSEQTAPSRFVLTDEDMTKFMTHLQDKEASLLNFLSN